MADFTLSPSMNLPIPTVGVDGGPDYAFNINNSLTLVDGHNHSSGQGVQIQPAGLNINSDLTFLGNNAIALRTVRFQPQVSTPNAPSDIGCIYGVGVDVYITDGAGNVIRVTQNGALAGASGTISNLTSPASAAYSAPTFIFQSNTNVPANLDAGSIIIRNVIANSNGITLSAPSSLASNYSLTLPLLPSQLSYMTINTGGSMGSQSADQIGQAMTSVGANNIANVRTRAVNSTAPLGGIAIAPNNSGNFTTASTTPVLVANQGVILTTAGRPVSLNLNGAVSNSFIAVSNSGSVASMVLTIHRNGNPLIAFALSAQQSTSGITTIAVPPASFNFTDLAPAGTNTYEIFVNASGSGDNVTVSGISLMAYEI